MTTMSLAAVPKPDMKIGIRTLQELIRERSMLAGLSRMQQELGDIFRISLPGFDPFVLVGPEANRFILAGGRENFLWRNEADPVTRLFQDGLLVLDGDEHDQMRRLINPALHRRMLSYYVEVMLASTDEIIGRWPAGKRLDLLGEMRKVTLLILMRTLFADDFSADLEALLPSIMRSLRYISPGPWLLWSGFKPRKIPSPIQKLDNYLYQLIASRRSAQKPGEDMLGILVAAEGLSDSQIRDQLITMLIAGHDTGTSLLAWALFLIGKRPNVQQSIQMELQDVLWNRPPDLASVKELNYLDKVVKETLRLYPPIHLGSRIAAADLDYHGYEIPEGSRVIYSIYLTHRLERYWPSPNEFRPGRFDTEGFKRLPPYTYLPFGGGPRNCIGFAFAQVEILVVLARIFQQFEIQLDSFTPHVHMGASLEPRPGIFARVLPKYN